MCTAPTVRDHLTPATAGDIDQIIAFLNQHVADSMFPLVNLRDHGLGTAHPRSMSIWIARTGPDVTGLIGCTAEGMIMPQLPDLTSAAWGGMPAALSGASGRNVIGVIGAADQSARVIDMLGLGDAAFRVNADEESYILPLDALVLPDCTGYALHQPNDADRPLMKSWRAQYCSEVLGTPLADAPAQAGSDVDGYLERDSHRILMQGGTPVAMTGFNAQLPDTVQIGGVFTPPHQRNRGHARRAVALHLAEARRAGATQAVLFAASTAAAAAYRAIGFIRRGTFRMALLDGEVRVTCL